MNKELKETLMNAVVSGTVKNVQTLFKEHKLELDDSYFDYKLLKAALLRNIQGIVKVLLKIGCRAKNPHKSEPKESLLHIASRSVRSYNDEIIKKLVDNGASLYDKNLNGETPIQTAFKKGQIDAVKALLWSYRPNSEQPLNKDDLLHFHIACVVNEYFSVERYLKSGIDPNTPLNLDSEEYDGLTPIQFAIMKKYSQVFGNLVAHNGDLSLKNIEGLTPLHTVYYTRSSDNAKSWIKLAFEQRNKTKFINSEDNYGLSQFHMCCMLDEPDLIKVFIDNGVNVNSAVSKKCPKNPGFTPLHFAVINGCQNVIKLLLKSGADPNILDKKGKTPLHLACKMTKELKRDIIKTLLKYKARPDIANKKGCTPLHETFYYINSEGFQTFNTLLSNTQWQSDNCTDDQGLSLFHIACTTDNINQVVKFLDSGVDVDSCPSSGVYSGFTALHFAVMYNQKDVVKILLKKNANVNAKAGETGVTPLHLACEFNYMKFDQDESTYYWVRFQYNPVISDLTASRANQLEIIKLLLSHGSHVNAKDSLGVTPLLHTCMIDTNYFKLDWTYLSYAYPKERDDLINEISTRLKEIIEILLSNKANVKSRTKSQSSIFHMIGKYSTIKILDNLMKFLIASGADVNAVDIDGLTPLHVAVKYDHKMFVRRLLKYNADPNVKCKNSRVPLHIAVQKIVNDRDTKDDTFCALVENFADVNIIDHDGSVMLHTVIDHYSYKIIEKLLYYGADINMKDSSGNTAVSKVLKWEKGENWMVGLYGKLFKIIFCHVQKLFALGLPVSKEVQKGCIQLYPRYQREYKTDEYGDLHSLENVFDDCIRELDKMKSIKIDCYTSLYDILLKDSHELTKYVNNSNLNKVLKEQSKFPLYGFLLELQYHRGSTRNKVLQSAESALLNVLNVHLPDLCSNLVLKYLTNEEISNLKKAAPEKRNLKRKLRGDNQNQVEPASKLQKKIKPLMRLKPTNVVG